MDDPPRQRVQVAVEAWLQVNISLILLGFVPQPNLRIFTLLGYPLKY
jgi:hypothetical protein